MPMTEEKRARWERTRILGSLLRMGDTEALAEVRCALEAGAWKPARAAKTLGVERKTIYNWLDAVPILREEWEERKTLETAARAARAVGAR